MDERVSEYMVECPLLVIAGIWPDNRYIMIVSAISNVNNFFLFFFIVSHQIPALADAGFRVLALDMKGYGDSTAPPGQL